MTEPGSAAWYERVVEVLTEEAANVPSWWWLSFTDPTRPKGSQFLGVAIVRAGGLGSATIVAHALGINPGGQVLGIEIPPEHVPRLEFRERLLSREEAESL